MIKANTLVYIIVDNGRFQTYGVPTGEIGTDDYPNDYWIKFSDDKQEPYNKNEFEIVTVDDINKKIDELNYLKGKIK